jgi:phosphoribosylformimino-5-aminoimidazole carboxamide ribotide isomerase
MRIIPVLDIKAGQVVRGIAGRRAEYRPIVSRLTTSAAPLDVAQAFRQHFGLTTLYLADLDAIAGAPPAQAIYETLQKAEFQLWVDAGVRNCTGTLALAGLGLGTLVLGLETLTGPDELAESCRALGHERVMFSLDLNQGSPLGTMAGWRAADAWSIAVEATRLGVRRLLILDLARVGMEGGTGTEELCSRLAAAYPTVEIAAGGGVRDVADLRRLSNCGVQAVLIASALHDGRFHREDLAEFG